MSSNNDGKKSCERQFAQFREVARKLGTERLADELERSLARLVSPKRRHADNHTSLERASLKLAQNLSEQSRRLDCGQSHLNDDHAQSGRIPDAQATYMRLARGYDAQVDSDTAYLPAANPRASAPGRDQS